MIVERVNPLTKLRPWENIYDYNKYKYADFQYRVVRDTDADKWGNIDVILTEYVEGKKNYRRFRYAYLMIRCGIQRRNSQYST